MAEQYCQVYRDETSAQFLFTVAGAIHYADGNKQFVVAGERVLFDHGTEWVFEGVSDG